MIARSLQYLTAASAIALSPIVNNPPPPPLPSGTYYYLSRSGNDLNPGTEALPFGTLAKAVPLLKPGETLLVRTGEYDTAAGGLDGGLIKGGNSIVPSGASWDKPVTIKAYPGEKVTFRRYLPVGYPHTEEQVRNSIHLPTYEECANYASYGLIKDFPYSCWQGSGNNQPAGGLFWQAPLGYVPGYVIDLYNSWTRVKYVVFDGIDIDAKGIVPNPVGFSDYTTNIRFQNLEIKNGIGSCISQNIPEAMSNDFIGDLIFFRVKIHSCGVPYDTNKLPNGQLARKSPWARYWHGWYLHGGGASFLESESYNHAGTGLGPDGKNIVVKDSYIHDNSAQGIYITGVNWMIENNVFTNNGAPDVYYFGGPGHVIRQNTVVAGSGNKDVGIFLHDAAGDSLIERNLIYGGYARPVYNRQCGLLPDGRCFYSKPNILKNNWISDAASIVHANPPVVKPIEDGNVWNKPHTDAVGYGKVVNQ